MRRALATVRPGSAGSRRLRRRIARGLAVLGLGLCGLGMTCISPPPDPDGTPQGSQDLALDSWRRDAIDCGGFFAKDCADWYRIEIPAEGTLRLDIAKVTDEREPPEFTLVLGEASGRVIQEEPSSGRTRVRIDRRLPAGAYTVAVSTSPESGGAMDYEIRAGFRPKPHPAPAPRFSVVKAALLEVESRPEGGEAVLLDKGSRAGIAPGQRGRLLQGGEKIGEIEILDVYPDGSRAVIRGTLGAAITPSTVAEVEVPL